MVALRNPHRRPVTVVIAHPDSPKTDIAVQQSLVDPRTGEPAQRRVQLRVPESLVFRAGEVKRDLPDYVREESLRAGLELVEEQPQQQQQEPPREEGQPLDAVRVEDAPQPPAAEAESATPGRQRRKGAS